MSKKSKTYRELRDELDEVMQAFESSSHADVDEMLQDYEKASKIIAELEAYLDSREVTLKKMQSSK